MKPLDAIDMREEYKFYSLFNLNSIQFCDGDDGFKQCGYAVANGIN